MKKIQTHSFILLLFLLLGIQRGFAQNNETTRRSISSLSSYIDVPINEATGIPDINIPLLDVPMPNGSVNYPISLRYNVRNYDNVDGISDVGQGWSLFASSLMYRETGDTDSECIKINSPSDWKQDIYYYNILGLSGKFSVKKNVNTHLFEVVNLSPTNRVKIGITDNSSAAVLRPKEFTITTDQGYKYYFHKIDSYQFECFGYAEKNQVFSTYYLSKIVNPLDSEIATMEYQIQEKNIPGEIVKRHCKIKSIKTSKGEVSFDFAYDRNLENTVNDPYWLTKITLKNPAGKVEYSYIINTSISDFPSSDPKKRKRILNYIRKNDKNDLKIEQTVFSYENSGVLGKEQGILEKITTPGGGIVEYKYEEHSYSNNTNPSPEKMGKRIKHIKYYKNSIDTSAERTLNYDYNVFESSTSSGYKYYGERNEYNDGKPVSYIIYKNVKIGETGKGYVKKTFITPNDYPKYKTEGTDVFAIYFWPYYNITRWGLPSKEEVYDEQSTLLSFKETKYEFYQYEHSDYDVKITPEYSWPGSQMVSSKLSYIKAIQQKESELYPNQGSIDKESKIEINTLNFKPSYIKSVTNGNIKEKFMRYPTNVPGYSHLETAHIIGVPVVSEEKENGKLLSRSKVLFAHGSLLPTSILSTNIADESSKESLKMDQYDDQGNLLQFTNKAGIPTALIYGYNQSSVLAKIEGATYIQARNLAQEIISASDEDQKLGTQASQQALLQALDTFRKKPSLSGYQITTYTHDPLIGITSTTPPSGVTQYYIYDKAGRLQLIRDKNGSIVQEYQYRYKNYKD
ncbi:hypothetical protein [Chryseobacterium indologenes]|uniref:hypothetical protein n=2 Tax=Bacteria TaxID=2 RepID=UPI0016264F48|nr:hypothetical protein [Chryseobacterium indologenes]